MKIVYFNNRKKDNIDLDLMILKSNNWLINRELPFIEYRIVNGDIPTEYDFTTISTSIGSYKILNYAFYKSQIDKYLQTDADICVFCYAPDGTPKINISEPTNVYKMNCCQCIIDGADAGRYIRHEIIHSIHWLALLQGLPVVDDQDQREKDANAYFTARPETKDGIEGENLQDVLKVLDRIKPNKSVSMVHTMLQSVVTLLTQLLNLKKKSKPSKEGVVEQFVQAHAFFEGFYKQGSIAQKYNNPGCLKYANQENAVKGSQGFAIFDTPEAGWKSLREQVKLNLSGKSSLYDINQDFYSYIYVYASTSPDVEKVAYAEYIAKVVGVSPNIKLKDLGK